MSKMLLSSLVLLLIANSVISGLVSNVNFKDIQLTPINNNKYNLRIRHSDGSTLEEIVEKSDTGRYEIRGTLKQPEFSPYGKLFVTFQKDSDGALRQYHYFQPAEPRKSLE